MVRRKTAGAMGAALGSMLPLAAISKLKPKKRKGLPKGKRRPIKGKGLKPRIKQTMPTKKPRPSRRPLPGKPSAAVIKKLIAAYQKQQAKKK